MFSHSYDQIIFEREKIGPTLHYYYIFFLDVFKNIFSQYISTFQKIKKHMSFNVRCCFMFRQGLWHLMELSRKPIFIIFQSQQKQMSQDISHQLRQHQPRITTLTWGAHSMVRPSQCSIHLRDLGLNKPNHSHSLPTDPFFRLLEGAGTGDAAQGYVSQGICRRSADSAAGR